MHVFFLCRYVLDGWPITMAQVDLLNKCRIIPVTIVELNISDEELLSRADVDRTSTDRYRMFN